MRNSAMCNVRERRETPTDTRIGSGTNTDSYLNSSRHTVGVHSRGCVHSITPNVVVQLRCSCKRIFLGELSSSLNTGSFLERCFSPSKLKFQLSKASVSSQTESPQETELNWIGFSRVLWRSPKVFVAAKVIRPHRECPQGDKMEMYFLHNFVENFLSALCSSISSLRWRHVPCRHKC